MARIKIVGIIAEDESDFESARILIERISGKSNLGYRKKIGNGCGKLRRKCLLWSNELSQLGCGMLVLIHDLDRNDLPTLSDQLSTALRSSTLSNRLICIPVEEIEAWFLADPTAIKRALNLRKLPRFSGMPEQVDSPKERLRDEVFRCSDKNKDYLNTRHNQILARHVDISLLRSRSPSFSKFYDFVSTQHY